jgi:hypothetical protein
VTATVDLVDPEPNGLADLLAGLLRGNLERDPERARFLRPARIHLAAVDADTAVVVEIAPGHVRIANASERPPADVSIRARSGELIDLAAAPLVAGLPSPFHREGRRTLRRIVSGRVRVSGMLRHPMVVTRFARCLSVTP